MNRASNWMRRKAWTYNRMHKDWTSPCGHYAAQRENTRRWSLWRMRTRRKRSSGQLLGDHHISLQSCKDDAHDGTRSLTERGLTSVFGPKALA